MSDYLPPPAPPRSALTLRLWLAGFGLVFNAVAGWLALRAGIVWLGVVLLLLAVVCVVDFGWVVHRKRRGDPG
ncbi:PEP-CTERM protein-sorting domain-containing protein [Lentzea xinjiangensis]|uniref:PEP-CTERM protein-sorting domain-containing protein n=1 Tax=Lentzea xinjiangensis TaxID=402600 RepID=A0A1H9HNQ0_9PSEU|nr:DUF6343 family protein [Lentzea xinjiangensis]SEQ63969.1 PEP-CTERM protein-sorting domain-containing protein [Lentzea xinjiangensis]